MNHLNYFLRREEEELLRAREATSSVGRAVHSAMARAYGRRIRDRAALSQG